MTRSARVASDRIRPVTDLLLTPPAPRLLEPNPVRQYVRVLLILLGLSALFAAAMVGTLLFVEAASEGVSGVPH